MSAADRVKRNRRNGRGESMFYSDNHPYHDLIKWYVFAVVVGKSGKIGDTQERIIRK